MSTLTRGTEWNNATAEIAPAVAKQQITLSTANKYVDKDIKLTIAGVSDDVAKAKVGNGSCSVTGGTVSASATGGTASASASQTGMTAGVSSTATGYYFTSSASATGGSASASITDVKDAHTAGYIPAKSATTVIAGDSKNASGNSASDSSKVYLKEATCSVTGGTVSASATKGTASTSVTGMKTTTSNTGYSVHAEATGGNAEASIAAVQDAHTAGYLPAKSATTVIAGDSKSATGEDASETKYIVAATLANSATSGQTYADSRTEGTGGTQIIIPSGGALYINEGYIKNTKITLDEMLGGKADTAAISDNKIAQGYVVYDVDGVRHTGTMPNATASGNSASGAATASASITPKIDSSLYKTTATTGYTLVSEATASANSPAKSATATVTAGYLAEDKSVTASVTAASDSKTASLYILNGVITNNTSGGTSAGTIPAGKQIKIGKGYYGTDTYYTAQSASDTAAGSVTPSFERTGLTCSKASMGTVNESTWKIPLNTTHTLTGNAKATVTAGYIASSPSDVAVSETIAGSFLMDAYDGTYTVTTLS